MQATDSFSTLILWASAGGHLERIDLSRFHMSKEFLIETLDALRDVECKCKCIRRIDCSRRMFEYVPSDMHGIVVCDE